MIQVDTLQSSTEDEREPGTVVVDQREGQESRGGCLPLHSPLIDVSGVEALAPSSAKHVRRMEDTGLRTAAESDYGVFDPDTFWDRVLPYPAAPDGPSTFDARVEKAWRFVRNMFFKPEEHAAAREAMVRLCVIHEQNQE